MIYLPDPVQRHSFHVFAKRSRPLGTAPLLTLFPIIAFDDLTDIPEVSRLTGSIPAVVVSGAGTAVGTDYIPGATFLFQKAGAVAIRAILQFDLFIDAQCSYPPACIMAASYHNAGINCNGVRNFT